MGQAAPTIVAHPLAAAELRTRKPARRAVGHGELLPVQGEALDTSEGLAHGRIVADELLAVVVEAAALLVVVKAAFEVPSHVHCARELEAVATTREAETAVALHVARFAGIGVVVHGALRRTPGADLGNVACASCRSADLACLGLRKHAALATLSGRVAALVARAGELAGGAVAASICGRAVAASAVAVLAALHKAVAADGVALDVGGRVLQTLAVLGVGAAEVGVDVSDAA
mmetsp:Transcript_62792/g.180636  ORF Transcript_62792/g.180636 Transcript_62792/m.180636 type:complete len:232 (-) Transcript_62792:569-1264(-)